jgi:hypothetical protein
VVQPLRQVWYWFSQVWQQSWKARADFGFARTTAARTNAKKMNIRNMDLM